MRRLFASAIGITIALALVSPSLAGGNDASVTIKDNYFSLETTKFISTYGFVTWTNGGVNSHTTTSDQGFWHSGTLIGSGSRGATSMYQTTLYGAGTYPYHCELHGPSMSGKIRVPVVASTDVVFAGDPVTLTFGAPDTKNTSWDVQRRVNGGDWILVRDDIVTNTTEVKPKRLGYVEYRVRTTRGHDESSWSQRVRVDVADGG